MIEKPVLFQNPHLDGSTFYWQGKPGNETAVLLFHGFTATTVEVRLLAGYLHKLGYAVSGPLLPGHGSTPDDLNRVSWKDWVYTAENSYQNLRSNYQNIFVMGESMGGLVALWLTAKHPDVTGLALFAPALRIKNLWQSNFFWPFKKFIYKQNIDESTPWQGLNVVPIHAAAQLNRFQGKIRHNLKHVVSPAIIFQGKLDKTINPISSVEVLEGISSVEKELIWLEESSHCILLDKQLPEVQAIVIEFVNNALLAKGFLKNE
jgi:carboxylesterase